MDTSRPYDVWVPLSLSLETEGTIVAISAAGEQAPGA
jgi:hypothetical protein